MLHHGIAIECRLALGQAAVGRDASRTLGLDPRAISLGDGAHFSDRTGECGVLLRFEGTCVVSLPFHCHKIDRLPDRQKLGHRQRLFLSFEPWPGDKCESHKQNDEPDH